MCRLTKKRILIINNKGVSKDREIREAQCCNNCAFSKPKDKGDVICKKYTEHRLKWSICNSYRPPLYRTFLRSGYRE